MNVVAHALGNALLTPPGIVLVPLALGLLLMIRGYRTGYVLITGASLLLCALSLPVTAQTLMHGLETSPALRVPRSGADTPQAIVVLAGGRFRRALEYGGADVVSGATLLRLRYAARLYRETHLPLLVSGGSVFGHSAPEALLMRHTLRRDFGVPVRWVETRSRNTLQNARYSALLLRQYGIQRIYLVTQAWHMPRALRAFRSTGLQVVAAPTGFVRRPSAGAHWLAWLPSAHALADNARVFHEYLGMLWYRLGGG